MMVNTDLSAHDASFTMRATRWWLSKTDSQKRGLFTRGLVSAACLVTLTIGLPALSGLNSQAVEAAERHAYNLQLAEMRDAGAAIRADVKASELLKHDWLRAVEYSLERNPSLALSAYTAIERDFAALEGLTRIEVPRRSEAEDFLRQKRCLAQAVYYESGNERTSGQLAVAEVIINRVKDHRYPNTVCDVVFQGATRTTGCQFTFTCDGAMRRVPESKRWNKANRVASHVMMGLNEYKTSGATHYHATYVNPVWNSGLIRTTKIGAHIFYRFPRGSEWAIATARQNARLGRHRAGMKVLKPVAVKASANISVSQPAASHSGSDASAHIGTL